MSPAKAPRAAICAGAVFLIAIAVWTTWSIHPKARSIYLREGEDIYYSYLEGRRLSEGVNFYERVLQGDMRHNRKYATYLPGFYTLSALTCLLGFEDYPSWVGIWAWVFQAFHFGVAALLFIECFRRSGFAFAAFAALFWLFNRWTLYVGLVAHNDAMAIFFLFFSIVSLRSRPRAAALLLGVSLAIKQIAVFMLPLYAIWFWQQAPERRFARTALHMGWALLIPTLVSLPFFLWNPKAFVYSIAFSATRLPHDPFRAFSLDGILGYEGLVARIPLLILMALIYVAAARKRFGPFCAALLVFSVFTAFNTTVFQQYLAWMQPFLPVAVLEWQRHEPDRN